MKCKGVYKYICENLDADVNSPKCRAIKRHLDSCPNCAAYLDSLKKTILLYRNEVGPSVPIAVHKRLLKQIDLTVLGLPEKKQRGKGVTRTSC